MPSHAHRDGLEVEGDGRKRDAAAGSGGVVAGDRFGHRGDRPRAAHEVRDGGKARRDGDDGPFLAHAREPLVGVAARAVRKAHGDVRRSEVARERRGWRLIGSVDDDEPLLAQHLRTQPPRRRWGDSDRDVGQPRPDLVPRSAMVRLNGPQHEARGLRTDRRQDGRKGDVVRVVGQPQDQLAPYLARIEPAMVEGLPNPTQRVAHLGPERLGAGGGRDASGDLLEQPVAGQVAQAGDGLADGGLGPAQPLGGAAQVPLDHYRIKGDEEVEIDGRGGGVAVGWGHSPSLSRSPSLSIGSDRPDAVSPSHRRRDPRSAPDETNPPDTQGAKTMITSNLRTNQLSDGAYETYLAYLAAMDARDVDAYVAYLADDVSIQFGNAPAVTGKAVVREMLAGYWQSFAAIEHDLTNIYGTDAAYVLEADNHYVRHDGRRVTVRAVAFTDKDADGRVRSVRIYGDTSPVFASAEELDAAT